MSQPPTSPLRRTRRVSRLLGPVLCALLAGCAVRTVPPIRWVPVVGAEKKTSTTDVLVRALRDRDVAVRAQSVALLGVISQAGDGGLKREVAAVLGMALRDRDPGLRLQAVEQLGQMEAQYANKYLYSALRDPNPFVRGKVLEVVSQRERQASAAAAPTPQAASAPAAP